MCIIHLRLVQMKPWRMDFFNLFFHLKTAILALYTAQEGDRSLGSTEAVCFSVLFTKWPLINTQILNRWKSIAVWLRANLDVKVELSGIYWVSHSFTLIIIIINLQVKIECFMLREQTLVLVFHSSYPLTVFENSRTWNVANEPEC